MTGDSLAEAREQFERGDFQKCRDATLRGLSERPDDVELLRLAGKAALELGLDDAAGYLRKVSELQPDDQESWKDLGEALASEGNPDEASIAFRKALDLLPGDPVALLHLGHAAYALGQRQEAVSYLNKAAEREPENTTAVISLVEMYRSMGRPEEALVAARQVAEAQPDDVLAALDVADLSLKLGRLEEAETAFRRLREIDDELEHDVYSLHGMIQVEMRRHELRKALDLAVEATGVDRHGRTKDVLAFLVAKVFGPGDQPTPTEAQIEAVFEASQVEHRRLHLEGTGFEGGPYI